jgi:hypothetical protein
MTPIAELVRRADERPLRAWPGRDDVRGFAVVGLPFAAGDVLSLRCMPASTFGPGFTSVWHRAPSGAWTIYTTVAPELSCPRFIGAAASRVVETPIDVEWTGPFALAVRVPAAGLDWRLRLASTAVTRFMNAVMSLMPAFLFRSNLVLSAMSWMSTVLLAAGRFSLHGRMPNLQGFQAGPRKVWMVPDSRAALDGRDLGPLGPLATQAALGDFALPQRGVFMLGGVSLEAFVPGRHRPAVAGVPAAE